MASHTDIRALSQELAARAESFCRHFFPDGRKQGSYWQMADISGSPGQSLVVRLGDLDGRRAGNWTDYASDDYGDLIDLLHAHKGHSKLRDTLRLCRAFLGQTSMDDHETEPANRSASPAIEANNRIVRARRLFDIGRPIEQTLASAYLTGRGIKRFGPALHFHPSVYIWPGEPGPVEQHPALLAKITDNRGNLTGVARTFLDPKTKKVAQFEKPKRILGQLYGNAVRIPAGRNQKELIVGEGLENVLSVGTAIRELDLAACLTANHLGLFDVPESLSCLWIARDNDDAGNATALRLRAKAEAKGIWCGDLKPELEDFNQDLMTLGLPRLVRNLRQQLSDSFNP